MRRAVKELVRRIVPFPIRRAAWRVRRNVPRVAQPLSLAVPRAQAPERPIFVIGCPRAGTSALLQLLLRAPSCARSTTRGTFSGTPTTIPRPGLGLRRARRRGRQRAGASLHLPRGAHVRAQSALRRQDRRELSADPLPEGALPRRHLPLPAAPRRGQRQLTDRGLEGAATVRQVPPARASRRPRRDEREPLELRADPGWRQLRFARLEEICARQYIATNEAALDAREGVDPSRWLEVAYEDLVASPVETAERLCGGLGLAFDPAIEQYAATFDSRPSSTTLSAPRPDKWSSRTASRSSASSR